MLHDRLHQVYMTRTHYLSWTSNIGTEYRLFLLPLSSYRSQEDSVNEVLNTYGIPLPKGEKGKFDFDVETTVEGAIDLPNITEDHVMLVLHSPTKASHPFKRDELEDPYHLNQKLRVPLADAESICEMIKEMAWDQAFSVEDKHELARLYLTYVSDTNVLRQELEAMKIKLHKEHKEQKEKLELNYKEKERKLNEKWEERSQELESKFIF